MLARDLKAATSSSAKPEKSWKREFALQQEAQALQEKKKRQDSVQPDAFMLPTPNNGNQSYPGGSTPSMNAGPGVDVAGWFTEEDLGFAGSGLPFGQSPGGSAIGGLGSSGPSFLSDYPSSAADFPPSHPSFHHSGEGVPPIAIPGSGSHSTSDALSTSQLSISTSFPSNLDQSTSPRQRRRLDTNDSQAVPNASTSSVDKDRKQMAYTFNLPTAAANSSTSPVNAGSGLSTSYRHAGPVLPKGAIAHTGQSVYTLASSGLSPRPRSVTSNSTGTGGGDDGTGTRWGESASPGGVGNSGPAVSKSDGAPGDGPDSELADVIGQLSLNENEEVRYHGR